MDQHQIVAYVYMFLSLMYVLIAIGLVRWVRKEREKTFHDVNKLIGDALSYHRKRKVKYFKVSPPPEEDFPVAEEEVVEVIDDECPTKTDLNPV